MPSLLFDVLQADLAGVAIREAHVDGAGEFLSVPHAHAVERMPRDADPAQAGAAVSGEEICGRLIATARPGVGPDRIHEERRGGRRGDGAVALEKLGPFRCADPAADAVGIACLEIVKPAVDGIAALQVGDDLRSPVPGRRGVAFGGVHTARSLGGARAKPHRIHPDVIVDKCAHPKRFSDGVIERSSGVLLIHERGGRHLAQVAHALDLVRLALCFRERGEKHASENGDDRNDNQELDKRKAMPGFARDTTPFFIEVHSAPALRQPRARLKRGMQRSYRRAENLQEP